MNLMVPAVFGKNVTLEYVGMELAVSAFLLHPRPYTLLLDVVVWCDIKQLQPRKINLINI